MKKIIMIAAAAIIMSACHNDKTSSETKKDTVSSVVTEARQSDSARGVSPAPVSPAMSEGDMMMKGGKMMIMKSGQWTALIETTTNANGDKVMVNGDLVMKSGMKMKFQEGEALKTNGQMLDSDGNVMDM